MSRRVTTRIVIVADDEGMIASPATSEIVSAFSSVVSSYKLASATIEVTAGDSERSKHEARDFLERHLPDISR